MQRFLATCGAMVLFAFSCAKATSHIVSDNRALVTRAGPHPPGGDVHVDAERFLSTCAALDRAAVSAVSCTPAILAYSRELIHGPAAAQPVAASTETISSKTPQSPGSTSTGRVETTDAAIAALLRDASQLSDRIARASARGQLQQLADLRAELKVRHRALRIACDAGAIHDDPLRLLPRNILVQWRDALKRSERHLGPSAALAAVPERMLTLKELGTEIAEFDAAIEAYDDAHFHLARDGLPSSFDVTRWEKATANESEQIARETRRQQEVFAARFPDLWSPLPQASASLFEHLYPLSARVRKAVETYRLDPPEWLHVETRLISEFSALKRLPSKVMQRAGLNPSTKYKHWFVAQLNDRDLAAAIVYAKANVAELSRDPVAGHINDVDLRHFEDLLSVMREEHTRRAAGSVGGLRRFPLDGAEEKRIAERHVGDGELSDVERVYEVRLAEARWATATGEATAGTMPADIAEMVKRYRSDSLSAELASLELVVERLAKVELDAGVGAKRVDGLNLLAMRNARTDVEAVALTLSQRSRDRRYATVPKINDIRKRINTVFFVLGIPPNSSSDGTEPSATKPRGPPSAMPPETSGMALTDAVLTARLVNVRENLETAEASLGGVQVVSERPSHADLTGRRITTVAQLDQVAQGRLRFNDFRVDSSARRLAILTGASGKEKPYPRTIHEVSEVRNPSSIRSVGGGIHFTQTAKDTVPGEDDLAVSYDFAAKRLRVRSIGGRSWSSQFTIEPQSLKAIYRFAVSNRNMVVSMENHDGVQAVILDPEFVDTRVGQDLTLADKLPWRLGDPVLPDGRPNPIAARFRKARAEAESSTNLRLATLVDDDVQMHVEQTRFDLVAKLRYMYLSSIDVGQHDVAQHSTDLEAVVNGYAPILIEKYAPLRRVRDYAEVAAFLRWATTSKRVKRIDFRSLATVDAYDALATPTADQIGEQKFEPKPDDLILTDSELRRILGDLVTTPKTNRRRIPNE